MDKNKSLVKREDRWDLYDENGHKIASTLQGSSNMISLKNCQAIERGYDLDELAHIRAEILNSYTSGTKWADDIDKLLTRYREVIELIGDKKFSENDIHEAYFLGERDDRGGLHDILKSKQQDEWDVEVEMEGFVDEEGIYCGERPKLDADACIILKLAE